MRGRASVESLALIGTEVMKLCTQTAQEHVTSACVQHAHFAKSVEKNKNPQPFYSMSLQTKSMCRSRRQLLTYSLLVFL